MSSNQSTEELECPLCMEPFEVDDLNFFPCTCLYQICRFCWNRIREGENGLCPACRKAYPENPADFTPLSQEQVAAMKTEKRAREQQRRNKTLESRRQLSSVRVVQKNLVFVVGLPIRLADPEILKKQEYFGKYGKIHKVVINHSTAYAGSQGPSASAYVTYVNSNDALRAIQNVNNVTIDGRVLKGSLGTTKYCANFMRNQPCPKTDCMYLHDLGDPNASFTKEEMHQGLHQIYEKKLHNQLLAQQESSNSANSNNNNNSSKGTTHAKDSSPTNGMNQANFIPSTVVTSSSITIIKSKSKNGSNASNGGSSGGTLLSSSSSSSSSSLNSKEAWPSLNGSPASQSPGVNEVPSANNNNGSNNKDNIRQGSSPSPPTPQTTNKQPNNSNNNNSKTKQNKSNKENHNSNSESTSKNNKSAKENKKGPNNNKKSKGEKQNGQQNNKHSEKRGAAQTEIAKHNEVENKPNGKHELEKPDECNQEQVFNSAIINGQSDELELDADDRHSLLDNHDLLDNSEHGLLEDEEEHCLLANINQVVNDTNMLMMNRRSDMIGGLGGPSLMPRNIPLKSASTQDFASLENRAIPFANDINHPLLSESNDVHLLREIHSNDLLRQNEMLARRNHGMMASDLGHKQFFQNGIDNESRDVLGNSNMYPNRTMLPPFGLRMDSGNGSSNFGLSPHANQTLGSASLLQKSSSENHILSNVFVNEATSKGRYQGENSMNKFFTDFHKNQQIKSIISQRNGIQNPPEGGLVQNHIAMPIPSLAFIESQHMKRNFPQDANMSMHFQNGIAETNSEADAGLINVHQRSGNTFLQRKSAVNDHNLLDNQSELSDQQLEKRSVVDDDLDFDPIKESQKGFSEMMATGMMQNDPKISPELNDKLGRRAHPAPTGFTHMNAFGIGVPRPQPSQGYSQTGMVSDWTQIDPAIMSTSFNFPQSKNLLQMQQSQQMAAQQDLYARFNQSLTINPTMVNGVSKLVPPSQQQMQQQQQQLSLFQQQQQQQGRGLHLQNGLVLSQQQQQQLMNNQVLGNQTTSPQQQQYMNSYMQQQRKLHGAALLNQPNQPPTNGWGLSPANNVQLGQYANTNGYYNGGVNNPLSGGPSSSLEMNQNGKFFANATPKNNAPVATAECIESN